METVVIGSGKTKNGSNGVKTLINRPPVKGEDVKALKAIEAAEAEADALAEASEGKTNPSEEGAKGNEPVAKANEPQAKETKIIPMMTAGDRLDKLEQLNKLNVRYSFLKKSKKDVLNFRAGKDGTAAMIELSHNQDKVKITNPVVIEKVLNLCDGELDKLIAETEQEVLNFHI